MDGKYIISAALMLSTFIIASCGSDSDKGDGGGKINGVTTYTVTVDDPGVVIGNPLITEGDDAPSCSVCSNQAVKYKYNEYPMPQGETLTFRPEIGAYNGYAELDSVTGCGAKPEDGNTDGLWITEPIHSDCTVTVTYKSLFPDAHLISTRITGYGGTIEPTALTAIDSGTALFKIAADKGYKASVDGCGGEQVDGFYKIIATDRCTINAEFTPESNNGVNVSITHSEGGYVEFSDFQVAKGSKAQFGVYPGYGFTPSVTDSGCGGNLAPTGEEGYSTFTYTTGSVNEACTIAVTFEKDDPSYPTIEFSFSEPGEHKVEAFTVNYDGPRSQSNIYLGGDASFKLGHLDHFVYYLHPAPGYEIDDVKLCSDKDYKALHIEQKQLEIRTDDRDCEVKVMLSELPRNYIFKTKVDGLDELVAIRPRIKTTSTNRNPIPDAQVLYTNGEPMISESFFRKTSCTKCNDEFFFHPRHDNTSVQFLLNKNDPNTYMVDAKDESSCLYQYQDHYGTRTRKNACFNYVIYRD